MINLAHADEKILTLEIAANPLGTSANFKPADGERYPGNLPAISGVM